MFKKDEKKLETPDPKLTDAAKHGDPMAAALAEEVAKDEKHPATKATMAARAPTPALVAAPVTPTGDLLARFAAFPGHASTCETRQMAQLGCTCGWGALVDEAKAALG